MKIAARKRIALPVAVWPLTALLVAMAAGCGGGGGDEQGAAAVSCPAPAPFETQMNTLLAQASSEVDFSFSVERQDGHRYTFNRGGSTMQTSYESKSASKLVSAVMILRVVEQTSLDLSDRPQAYIANWPILSPNPLSAMTLAQLLSFTSGLTNHDSCLDVGSSDFEECVISVANANASNSIAPGQEFFYASTHLQVAGLMAVEASGAANWQAIVTDFKAQTGLFPSSNYDSPSSSNPNLAGGMHFTGQDYMGFLSALKSGSLLNAASMIELLTDRTVSIPMAYSPIFSGLGVEGEVVLGEAWHYGFGLWHELADARVSSPGALGTYPFWDRSRGYTGIVVRAGAFGTLTTGINIERSVRPLVNQWAAC